MIQFFPSYRGLYRGRTLNRYRSWSIIIILSDRGVAISILLAISILFHFILQFIPCKSISISLINSNSSSFIMDIDTTTTVVKLENQRGNRNFHIIPHVEDPRPLTFAARGFGAGNSPDPIIVEEFNEPVRDVFKAIDEESCMLDWLHSNRHMRAIVTYNQQRTVRTTTYTNVRIVSHERLSVTAGFEIVID